MDERDLFNRFHEAFEIQPRPGSYDRMRVALIAPPVVLRQRPGIRMRFTTMGLRVAAAMALAVLILVALVAFLTLHHPTASTPIPANTGQDLKAYQALFDRDYRRAYMTEADRCFAMTDNFCQASIERSIVDLQAWLQDMNGITPPARFVDADAMLRAHLSAAIVDGHATVAAQKAGNAALFLAASTAHLDLRAFYAYFSVAVASTRQVSVAAYRSSLHDQMDLFSSCTACGQYAGTGAIDCAGTQLDKCVVEVVAVDAQIYSIEAALVQFAAPSSLATKDAHLQRDLVAADAATLAMINAGITGDLSGFNSARSSLQVAIAAVNVDAGAVQAG